MNDSIRYTNNRIRYIFGIETNTFCYVSQV